MLVEFRFKNFKSFQEERVLSLVASSDKSLPENTFPTKSFGKHKLQRSAVVYGANASGKSNLIQAIDFVQLFVKESAKQAPREQISVQPFLLDPQSRDAPSEFEVTFIQNDIRYQYGFLLDSRRLYEEWLIAYPKGRAQTWFERSLEPDTETYSWYFGPNFKGEKRRLVDLTKASSLFLSVGATFNHEQLSEVYRWFDDYLQVVEPGRYNWLEGFTARLALEEPSFHATVQRLLQLADLGIGDFLVEQKAHITQENWLADLPPELSSLLAERQQLEIKMLHQTAQEIGALIPLSLDHESLGTRRLFAISGPLIEALLNGYVLCVDELDDSLHPNMVVALVSIFHDSELNPHNAQLIFNTHDVTLLNPSIFRRDQIWLVEKDRTGASLLYSLLEFSPRKDEAFSKGYLEGRYGAVPFIREDLLEGLMTNGKK